MNYYSYWLIMFFWPKRLGIFLIYLINKWDLYFGRLNSFSWIQISRFLSFNFWCFDPLIIFFVFVEFSENGTKLIIVGLVFKVVWEGDTLEFEEVFAFAEAEVLWFLFLPSLQGYYEELCWILLWVIGNTWHLAIMKKVVN